MKRYWISWYHPPYKLKTAECNQFNSIAGVWVTGTRDSDNYSTVCAVVDANTKEDAESKKLIEHYGNIEEWRFCKEKPSTYMPGGNRFPTVNSKTNAEL